MVRRVVVDGVPMEVETLSDDLIRVGDRIHSVSAVPAGPGRLSLLCGHASYIVRAGGGFVYVGSERVQVRLEDPRAFQRGGRQALTEGKQALSAPMPGRVVRLLKTVGARVSPGDGIVVVEAMKMQNELKAAQAGTVRSIAVAEGDAVTAGQVLATIEQDG